MACDRVVLLVLDKSTSGRRVLEASPLIIQPSHVLEAMGVPRRSVFGALRLTLGHDNTSDDVDTLLEAIPPLVARARQASAVAA